MSQPYSQTIYGRRPRPKSAWLAVNLSGVLPGLGQIYGGAGRREG